MHASVRVCVHFTVCSPPKTLSAPAAPFRLNYGNPGLGWGVDLPGSPPRLGTVLRPRTICLAGGGLLCSTTSAASTAAATGAGRGCSLEPVALTAAAYDRPDLRGRFAGGVATGASRFWPSFEAAGRSMFRASVGGGVKESSARTTPSSSSMPRRILCACRMRTGG